MRSPLRLLAAFVAVLTLFAAGMLWWQAERTQTQLRQQILSQSEKRSLQLADAMSGQISGLFGNFDLALLQLRRVWIEDRKAFDETAKAILGSFPEGAATHLSVTGRDGYVTYDSLGSERRFYVGDRPHFQRMKTGDDQLVIGRPVLSRITGGWSFVVGRPVLRGGRFDGAIQFLVSSDYMSKKLAGLELSPRDVVALMQRSDGAFIARSRDNDKAMGTAVPKDRPFLVADAPQSGIFRVEGLLDGTPRTYGWQQVRGYGLVVAIGLEDQAVLAPLASGLSLTRGLNAALVALIVLSGGIVAVLLLRLAGKQEEQAASEARFRSLAELSSDWYWEQDADFRFISLDDPGVSPRRRAQSFDGLRRWELRGVNLGVEQWAAHRAVLERHEVFRDFEYQRVNAEGDLRWVSISGVPIFDAAGNFRGYRGIGRDITEWKHAQQQIADNAATLRLVVDNVPVMIGYYDAQLRCRFSNRAYARFRGLGVAEIVGRSMREVLYEESWQEVQSRLPQVRAGQTVRYRANRLLLDGRRAVLDVALVPYIPAGGVIQGIFVLLNDVTEQALAEEQLRRSEARFRSLTDLSSDWYWEQDEHFRFRDIGDAGLRIDLHARNPVGKARWELDNTNLSPEQWAEHRALLERHEPFRDFEFMRMAADGQERWVRISGEPIFSEYGEFSGYRGVGKDITAAKQVEAALRSSEARFRSVFEQAAVGMTLRRLDGSWVAVNDVFAKMLGYSIEELSAGVQFNHPDDEPAAESRRLAMARGEVETYQQEKRYVTRDGRIIWVALWASVVRDQGQKPVMRLAVIQDITARKRAEEEIRRLNAELEQRVAARTAELAEANRELETFAYSVSHDLKAPLRGIDGYSQLLLENYSDRLDQEGRRFLQNVRQGAHNMSELIDDLLVYSRIERGGRSAEELRLRPLVEELVAELKADPAAVQCRVGFELPDLLVVADREGVTMAVRNLLDNAVKFSARVGNARVEVGGRDSGSSCILWVRDNGIGFDMKYHDRIFGIFERLQRTEDYPGTGVGLAIVRKAMSRMGGRVWAESAPGQGATFHLEIPKKAETA